MSQVFIIIYHLPYSLEVIIGVCGNEATITDEQRLYSEWVPTSGNELAELPYIECYYGPENKPRHEWWVPIITR